MDELCLNALSILLRQALPSSSTVIRIVLVISSFPSQCKTWTAKQISINDSQHSVYLYASKYIHNYLPMCHSVILSSFIAFFRMKNKNEKITLSYHRRCWRFRRIRRHSSNGTMTKWWAGWVLLSFCVTYQSSRKIVIWIKRWQAARRENIMNEEMRASQPKEIMHDKWYIHRRTNSFHFEHVCTCYGICLYPKKLLLPVYR